MSKQKVLVLRGSVHAADDGFVEDEHHRGRTTAFGRTRNYRVGEVATLSAADAARLVKLGAVKLLPA